MSRCVHDWVTRTFPGSWHEPPSSDTRCLNCGMYWEDYDEDRELEAEQIEEQQDQEVQHG